MQLLEKIVKSSVFNTFILTIVIVNSIVLGLQTSPSIVAAVGDVLNWVDKACLWIFVVEAVMKIAALRLKYFKSGWNWFDFLIVLASICSDFSALSSMRSLRIIRVFRALKFISGVRSLQIIVSAIGHSIPSMSWTSVLMLLLYYIFAVIGTMLFGEAFPEWFGSIGKSMYSLFQIMTLESWSMGIARPVIAVFPMAWIYFVPFVIIASFIILNIVVGIVVNSISVMSEKNKQLAEERAGKAAGCDVDKVDLAKEISLIEKHLKVLKEEVEKHKCMIYAFFALISWLDRFLLYLEFFCFFIFRNYGTEE